MAAQKRFFAVGFHKIDFPVEKQQFAAVSFQRAFLTGGRRQSECGKRLFPQRIHDRLPRAKTVIRTAISEFRTPEIRPACPMESGRTALNFCLSALVFAVFQRFVFGPLVKKHTARIRAYKDERHFFLKFFDKKAFAVMAVMMTGGIALRAGGLAPERFSAVFYTGLGASLLLAGALFGRNYGAALSRRRG